MGITNIAGFETGATATSLEVITVSGTASIQAGAARTGGFGLQVNPVTTAGGYVRFPMRLLANGGPDNATITNITWSRFYFRPVTLPAANSEEIAQIETVTSTKCTVRINSSGNLMLFNSAGTVQIGSTGSTVLATDGTWYRIEVYCETGLAATATVMLAVGDGVASTEITGTGNVREQGACSLYAGKVNNRNGNTVDFYYDDGAFSNSGYPGAGACEIMVPDGDGTYTAWTIGAGGGADWTNIDDPVSNDGDTTYLLSTSVDGEASTATLESTLSAGISGTINAAKAVAIVARNGSSTHSNELRLRSGATDSDTTAYISPAAYALIGKVFATDPNTAAAWTIAALDAVEVGVVEATAAAVKTKCTAVGLMVDFGPASGVRSYGYIF